ncbi:hypothetical protein SESBI_29416 [Sesbania bispinosa]|nr:hypothetical protein SESBI_29416 [Sesbania bispinosa]
MEKLRRCSKNRGVKADEEVMRILLNPRCENPDGEVTKMLLNSRCENPDEEVEDTPKSEV